MQPNSSSSKTHNMAARRSSPAYQAEKQKGVVRSPNGANQLTNDKPTDYTSHGVTDHDIFLLPGSDFQLLGFLTAVAALVRLFRIYQPNSVVFDEVQ
jgi:dolichyl-phosphate-mannose-protein mannosyltransferase